MVQYKRKGDKESENWHKWPTKTKYNTMHHIFYYFKIDGVLYPKYSAKFQEEMDRYWLWEKLSD